MKYASGVDYQVGDKVRAVRNIPDLAEDFLQDVKAGDEGVVFRASKWLLSIRFKDRVATHVVVGVDDLSSCIEKIEPTPVRKMTVAEICEALGEEIEIVKE